MRRESERRRRSRHVASKRTPRPSKSRRATGADVCSPAPPVPYNKMCSVPSAPLLCHQLGIDATPAASTCPSTLREERQRVRDRDERRRDATRSCTYERERERNWLIDNYFIMPRSIKTEWQKLIYTIWIDTLITIYKQRKYKQY